MNTILDEKDIQRRFESVFSFSNKEEEIDHKEAMISYRFLSEIETLLEERAMSKKDLAKKIGTSASYVTQLFRGNKILNLNFLARVEKEFDITFCINATDSKSSSFDLRDEDSLVRNLNLVAASKGRWVFHSHSMKDEDVYDQVLPGTTIISGEQKIA